MNIDQILQNSSSNSYLNDDFKSSNSPEQFTKEGKDPEEAHIQQQNASQVAAQRSFALDAVKNAMAADKEHQ